MEHAAAFYFGMALGAITRRAKLRRTNTRLSALLFGGDTTALTGLMELPAVRAHIDDSEYRRYITLSVEAGGVPAKLDATGRRDLLMGFDAIPLAEAA